MKQKRKVKSLLPQKSGGKTFLMLSLLILGLILCLGSLSLLTTSSVGAIGKDIKQVAYSGIDDKVEVLYHMDLADTEYLDKKVGEMYYEVSNGNFYIAGPSLVVNQENPSNEYKNEIGNNNYTNILGGAGNKINSDNITVIEGSQNKVAASNTNAVVLGGEGNEIIGNGGSDPAIMVGGSDNTIQGGHNGDVIIGGSNNTIGASVSNSFILGGNRNTVNANNVIVGGSNVTVDAGIDNIFAFSSNGSFSPNKSNMFYLNVARGLGVNVDSSKAGLSVNGPVSFGEVSISENCDNESLGVIGTWYTNGYGCLVGCTQKSLSHGNKWELLDRGLKCQDYCEANSMRCYNEMEKLEEPDPYESYCSKGVDTSNASACTPVWNSYKNVIFETALVNSKKYGGVCPEGAADKCVYQCNDGYYLVKDETYSKSVKGGETKCFAECTYTWNDIGTVVYKHNDTVVGYNKNIVSCANDNPDNGNGTKNDPLPEHCGNNQHKKTLVCSNGKMYIVSSGKRASTTEAAPAGYLWHDCATAPYQCAGKYDISKTYINNTLLDTIPSVTKDRNQVNGTRGIYKLCLDYKTETPTANEKYPGNEKCYVDTDKTGNIPYEKHFQFLGCKNGYDQHTRSTDPDYMCRKKCTHNAQNTTVTKKDMEKVTLYRTPDENCSNPLNSANVGTACEAKTFTCNDGTWTPDDGYSNINNYRYISCTEHGNACSDSNVSESVMLAHTDHSEYIGPCFRWWAYDNSVDKKYTYGSPVVKWQCNYKDKWYKLDGCNPVECYHANSSKTFCEYDYAKNGSCSSPSNGGGSVGYKYKHYEGSSWNSKSLKYKDTCDIYCNRYQYEGGYYRAGNSCYKNSVCGGNGSPTSHYGNGTGWDYYWTGTTDISHGYKDYYVVTREFGTPGTTGYKIEDKFESNWCYYCDSFYHLENGTCVSDKHDCRGEIPEHAEARWNTKSYSYSSSAGWTQSDVGGGECRFDCEDGYEWNGYACEEVECNSCTWKIMYDAGVGTVNPTSQKAKCDNSLTILEATSDCYDFIGRTDGSTLYTKGQPITKSSNTIISLTAVWGDVKNIPACQGGCKGGDQPESPYANMQRNDKVTGNTNVAWVYQSDKNAELLDCQWRCNGGYKKVGGTCVKQTCEIGTPAIPSEGVQKGASEYVGNSGKKWTRVDDTTTSLSECQWKCDTDNKWEWNGTTCVKKVVAGCETIANGYCPTGNQSDSKADLKAGDTKSGEKWKCKGTTTSKDCFECVNGYKASGTSYSNYKCEEYTCGGPAPTGTTLLKGKSTYVNNPTPSHTSWTYLTGVSQSNLKVCEWSCPNEYEKSGNTCIKTKYGACTNPAVHGKCKEGTPTISESAAKNITGGWKWQCKGTSQGENADCIECDIANGYMEGTDENGDKICVSTVGCPAPTITGVEGRNVSFDLNGADANATMLIKTEDNNNRPSGGDVSGTSSPRSLGSTPTKGYVKMRTYCKDTGWSEDSNVVEFGSTSVDQPTYPQMIIDSIEGCTLKYHFNGNDPISGKSCCTAARLDYSYDGVTFSPLTTTYNNNGISFSSHGKKGTVYLKYSLDGGTSWSSTVSYDMPEQYCCKTTKVDWNGNPFDWVGGGVYDSDRNLVGVLSEIWYYEEWQWANGNTTSPDWHHTTVTYNGDSTPNPMGRANDCEINSGVPVCRTWHTTPGNISVNNGYIPGSDNSWARITIDNGIITATSTPHNAVLHDCR